VSKSVELVHVHGVDAGLKPVVFRSQPADSRFVLALLVGVAGVKRVAHPREDLVVECQPGEQFRELPLDDFLANVGLVAPSLVSGAMVIHVALCLQRNVSSFVPPGRIDLRQGAIAVPNEDSMPEGLDADVVCIVAKINTADGAIAFALEDCFLLRAVEESQLNTTWSTTGP
jgi:hypothetical protein